MGKNARKNGEVKKEKVQTRLSFCPTEEGMVLLALIVDEPEIIVAGKPNAPKVVQPYFSVDLQTATRLSAELIRSVNQIAEDMLMLDAMKAGGGLL